MPEVSLLFPLFLQSSFMFFFKLLLLMFIFISHLVFYGLFLSTCWCCAFSFVRLFFSRISSFFFPSFCFTAYPFSINCFLFARDFQRLFHNSFIYLSISLLPQIHENQILNRKRAILLATFMLVLHQTKGNAFLSSLFILIQKLLIPFTIPRRLHELTIISKHYEKQLWDKRI